MMNEKVILTDCDGVLVDWVHGFTKWMIKSGYKRQSGVLSYDMEVMFGIDRAECKKLVKTIKKYRGNINRFYQKQAGILSTELRNNHVQFSYNMIKEEQMDFDDLLTKPWSEIIIINRMGTFYKTW